MFDVNTDDVAKALKVKEGKFKSKATKSVKSRVTNLKPYLGDITVEDFKNLLIEWFDREYGLKKVELTEKQKQEILDLRERKYATDDWNLGRSPKADIVRGDFFRCGQVEFHFSIEKHRIKDVKITGDFFPTKDIAQLEESLRGTEYSREALQEVLENSDLEGYFGDVTAEELLQVIV